MNLSVHIQPKTDFIFQPHNRTNIQEWAPNLTKNTPKIGLKMGHIQDWDPRVFFIVNYRGGGRFQEKKITHHFSHSINCQICWFFSP